MITSTALNDTIIIKYQPIHAFGDPNFAIRYYNLHN